MMGIGERNGSGGFTMSMTIRQTMLIRASAARVYHALTAREEISAWWGQLNEQPDDAQLWPGRDRQWPITVRLATPNISLHLALRQHHPFDESRSAPSLIRFHLEPYNDATLVHVLQYGIPDEEWRNLLRDGWTWSLYYLQAWVETGRSLEQLGVKGDFAIIRKQAEVEASATWCWQALTDGALMSGWMDATVDANPVHGGEIAIRWDDGSHVGGEYVLLDEPRTIVMHWWDAESLERHGDPGLITVMHWSIVESGDGKSVITLTDTGYDRSRICQAGIDAIDQAWDARLGHLVALARSHIPGAKAR